ncbi:type II toxin-antitoxin system HipA family toxin [Desulfobacter vibrioformis]|uniref:type II toxin-antitoxin system HipA family toxin n=1 Tax=Desulfobacter vibrioformis TaxID=34031 RepID=UPI000550D645|nr:type II toxin-antitoxin system HipA family toxin [Desulfobacter vibrioformis]
MQKLNVVLTLPGGGHLSCGEIFTTTPDARGRIQGSFRYTKEYLSNPGAFPLDPVHLPLGAAEIEADRPQGIHGVFEDALPDDWGRALLSAKYRIPRAEQTVPNLLKFLGASGLGALSFYSGKGNAYVDPSAGIHDLSRMLAAALNFDAGLPVDENDLNALFICGSSPGGARPKALIKDNDGRQWIAKFPRLNDRYHVEAIEAGTLWLAVNAGLNVPDFSIRKAGNRSVLLVERFDMTPSCGRNHMISMQTLLGADGYYNMSYSDMFVMINKFSSKPRKDTDALFRQMVFNAAISNTDDHLKNFAMLYTESGFCLSPAYDLVPDIYHNREHRLSFPQGAGTLPPGRKILERIGNVYKVSNPGRIMDDVYQSVSRWQDVFEEYDVPEKDIQRLEPAISRGLSRLGSQTK